MAVSSVYKCDMCGKQKETSNHWYSASDLYPANEGEVNQESLGIHRWPKYKDGVGTKHLCGAECVMKYVAKFLGAK